MSSFLAILIDEMPQVSETEYKTIHLMTREKQNATAS